MTAPDDLFADMAKHPQIAPVFQLLALVEPVDEFSRALCLVRDCFDPNATLRELSRGKLRKLMSARVALLTSYQAAVVAAVPGVKSFMDAIVKGDRAVLDSLRRDFEEQAAELMARPLKSEPPPADTGA